MASITYETKSGGSKLFLLLILMVAVALFAIIYSPHAVANHGDAAWQVRNCINKNGAMETWSNPDTGRDAVICKIGSDKFGIQIRIGNREITSFIKEKLTRIDQVYQYLKNSGYRP